MIAFFGASVTEQKNGYVDHFSLAVDNIEVKKYGYGGMHLCDAGICFIDEVVKAKPTHCYVDWFSTSYNDIGDNTISYIDTIINKLTSIQCKVIFLFFPSRSPEKSDFYQYCKAALIERNIHYIPLDEKITNSNIETILRDNIHTTAHGSRIYSEIILGDYYRSIIPAVNAVNETKYLSIKKLNVEKCFDEKVVLTGNCSIIGFLLTIGNHSGIVRVKSEMHTEEINTWDRWCHFPRLNFKFPMKMNGSATLEILDVDFDTSSCKEIPCFRKFRKSLIIHNIFYIGGKLEVVNACDGKKINHVQLKVNKTLGRIKQKLRGLKKFGFHSKNKLE
ncbi:hypothetical protein [Pseudaeromonas paramecii]|uniref:Uncharacterized protein n=1 Tax=Pseudaeromonas paramecii TaxID=2138166 RepID=A0ABP8QF64_9GAMM